MLGDNDLCMKSNNCISEKINEYRSEVETMIQGFQRQILEQEHKIEELKNSKERELDTLFKDLLSVVDAYEKAEARLDEQYSDNEAVIKAKKRFSTSKKKLMEILRKNGVSRIILALLEMVQKILLCVHLIILSTTKRLMPDTRNLSRYMTQ